MNSLGNGCLRSKYLLLSIVIICSSAKQLDPNLNNSEIKNRQKLREKEEAKKKKEEEKKAKAGNDAQKVVKDEDLDPTQYTENRKNWIQGVRDQG